jgi:hypothetical protein
MNDFINLDILADRIAAKLRDLPTKRILNLRDAALYLGVTEDALRHKVYNGKISTVDFDNRIRFDRHDLDRMIEASKNKGTAA